MGVKRIDLEAYTGSQWTSKDYKSASVPEETYVYLHQQRRQAEIIEFKPDVHCRAIFNVQLR